jgi:hypothetical protein
MKIVLILLAAILLGSSAPAPTPPGQYEVHGVVMGLTSGGQSAPIGEFTSRGRTVEEAAQNARILEAQIRQTATAQALAP